MLSVPKALGVFKGSLATWDSHLHGAVCTAFFRWSGQLILATPGDSPFVVTHVGTCPRSVGSEPTPPGLNFSAQAARQPVSTEWALRGNHLPFYAYAWLGTHMIKKFDASWERTCWVNKGYITQTHQWKHRITYSSSLRANSSLPSSWAYKRKPHKVTPSNLAWPPLLSLCSVSSLCISSAPE